MAAGRALILPGLDVRVVVLESSEAKARLDQLIEGWSWAEEQAMGQPPAGRAAEMTCPSCGFSELVFWEPATRQFRSFILKAGTEQLQQLPYWPHRSSASEPSSPAHQSSDPPLVCVACRKSRQLSREELTAGTRQLVDALSRQTRIRQVYPTAEDVKRTYVDLYLADPNEPPSSVDVAKRLSVSADTVKRRIHWRSDTVDWRKELEDKKGRK